MKPVKVTGSISEFKGKPVSPVINFEAMADQYETVAEIHAAGAWPNDGDILKWRNAVSKANARQKAYAAASADLQAAYEKSAEFKRQGLINGAKIGQVDLATLAGILELKGYDAMSEREVAEYNAVETASE